MFVGAYAIRMGGGFLRFQAQYLRRIRLPQWDSLPPQTQEELVILADSKSQEAIDRCIARAYGLSENEQKVVQDAAEKFRVKPK